jgi:hypothetical protein
VITSKSVNRVVLFGILILISWATVRAARGPDTDIIPGRNPYAPPAPVQPAAGSADVLAVVPAQCISCFRIRNFEYTINQIDQFLVGISPVPMMLSMGLRTQFAGVLGNPQLAGIDMNGTFGFFAVPLPGSADPNAPPFTGVLVPVSDYSVFVGSNPNVAQPDAQGVSQIAAQFPGPMVAKQAGAFALVTMAQDYDALLAMADMMTSGRSAPLSASIDPADAQSAAPVWAYINAQGAMKLLAPIVSAQMGQAGAMPGAPPTAPGMPPMDFSQLAQNMDVQSVTVGLTPTQTMVTAAVRISTIPGTETAQMLVRGSPELGKLFDSVGAKAPGLMGPQMSMVSAMLPQAAQADVVGTFDLMQLIGLAAASSPVPLPVPDMNVPSRSRMAYAITADAGMMTIDIAVPKEHIIEIVANLKNAEPQGQMFETTPLTTTEEEPVVDDEISRITQSPFGPKSQAAPQIRLPVVQPGRSPFGDTTGSVGLGTAPKHVADENVRVAGVRLVRYADLELGILPLGYADGYTLSLIADLPASAVKVSGGSVEKALTNTGANLLPTRDWDRRIRFARLSKDHRTAVFDVELLLPDEDAAALEELAGTIEYLTASGVKNVDLGVMTIEVGAKASELGANISSIEIDPYKNNAATVGLTLDVAPEQIESLELYGADGAKLQVNERGRMSLGGATTIKFSVNGPMPQKAKIVLNVFEGLRKNELAFRIVGISLAGLPIR